MIRVQTFTAKHVISWPRTSGDDPHTTHGVSKTRNVGPARAGMIQATGAYPGQEIGWPRTSGDDPQKGNPIGDLQKLTPHERG